MAQILHITPVKVDVPGPPRPLAEAQHTDNERASVGFSRGPRHIEYHSYESLVLPDLLRTIVGPERSGDDAAVIGCFYAFDMEEGRELTVRMVVAGPCESSLPAAVSLDHTSSIVVGRRKRIL